MSATIACPDCDAPHDPAPCARDGSQCDCCAAMFAGPDERAAACADPLTPYYTDASVTLYQGDALEVAGRLDPGSIDCVVTSPPYFGLRDYGVDPTDWPAVEFEPMPGLPPMTVPAMTCALGRETDPWAFVGHLTSIFREVKRALSDDGTLWLNLGDSYSGKANGGATFDRHRGQGHKAGIVTPQINTTAFAPYKSLLGIPWRVAFALVGDGWTLRNAVVWRKPNAMPDSVADRLSCTYEHMFLLTKSPRYHFALDAIREPHARDWTPGSNGGRRMSGGVSFDRGDHLNTGLADAAPHPLGRNPGDVWTIATQPFPGAHFATMPRDLPERCIAAGCRAGGVVLDMFSGSGTTGLAATRLGRRYVGGDLSREYLELSLKTRLAQSALIDESLA